MENNLSPNVQKTLTFSREEAQRLGNGYIGPEHLLLGILRDKNNATELLAALNVNMLKLKTMIEDEIRIDKSVDINNLP